VAANGPPAAQNPPRPAPELAQKFIGFGDNYFGQKKFADALDRYQKAARADPGNADAFFRQGLVFSAMGRYGQAVNAFSQGMKVNPAWPTSDFLLTDIYGADETGRNSTVDALARAAQHDPTDGDVALLLGIHYYFDGQRDLAKSTFQQTTKLRNDGLAEAFLK
jgi:Flp pilus assembly protein TadD